MNNKHHHHEPQFKQLQAARCPGSKLWVLQLTQWPNLAKPGWPNLAGLLEAKNDKGRNQ
jgi:hypothetical protein